MRAYALLILFVYSSEGQEYTFPSNFQFGLATASYQVEGAWNVSGKGENIWDRLTHTRSYLITDGSNGDIACDTYHKTEEDVQLLRNIGVDFYRFSLSWSRILPTGHSDTINPDGIRYYNELIDELLAYNITPFVTLFHWDLPQPLQDIGGWPNPTIALNFEDFCRVVFESFGDRVKNWLTFNEPGVMCDGGYGVAHKAPAFVHPGIGGYLCGHTLLNAHAKCYHLYDNYFRSSQQGRIGITIDTSWYEPETNSTADIEIAEQVLQVNYGWFANPIFSSAGDYPAVMRQRVAQLSLQEGFPRSRLPEFTSTEVDLLRGSFDFVGLNHYTSHLCAPIPADWTPETGVWHDAGGNCHQPEEWESSASSWLKVVPWGFRKILNWIDVNYDHPEIIITENGFSDRGGLEDCRRINYYNSYLTELLYAMHIDGVNVTGYAAWSFLDNFEWMEGFTEKFGIYNVDFDDPNRPRTAKHSSHVYRNILATRRIDWNYTAPGFQQCIW